MRPALYIRRFSAVPPLLCLFVFAAAAVAQDSSADSRLDPHKIKSAVACGECHVSEYEVWKKTPHALGFKTLHRKKAAENIAEKMGTRLIKRESLCLNCHYTPTVKRESVRAVSGVSCESCHGAGADWINVHNNYGGKGITHATETAEHKQKRIHDSLAAGMKRPSDLYPVIANCFSCHTVPEEELVNKGGHTTGSADFEFVAWMDKNIRHNFLQSFLEGDGTDNAERSIASKRVMYVVGRALEMEYSLRGMAAATQAKKRYAKAMSRRIRSAIGEIRAIQTRAAQPELDEMLLLVRGVKARAGNGEELTLAAEKVGGLTQKFLDRADGASLASLDPLVLGTAEADDFEEPIVPRADPVVPVASPTEANPVSGTGTTDSGATTVGQAAAQPTVQSKPRIIAGVAATGKIKNHIRPKADHALVGPSKCENCHGDQAIWWSEDKHYQSLDPFFEEDPKAIKIATLYGLRTDQMARGNRVCMDCHATVLPGREKRDARDGVGCEACHGPAKDYLEPHEKGEVADGLKRSGYIEGLKLGMTELRSLDTRAETCASCHYLTDERLLSAGHPSGKDFDFLEAMKKIEHWKHEDPGDLKAAFAAQLTARGPIPKVTLARREQRIAAEPTSTVNQASQAAQPPSSGETAQGGNQAVSSRPSARKKPPPRPSTTRVRPATKTSAKDPEAVTRLIAEPYPEIGPNTPIEELLIFLKQRLEALYRTVDPKEGKP